MEIVLRIDKVGWTFHHRPRVGRRDVAYIERRARKCGFYGEDWKLERVTDRELVFVRGNGRRQFSGMPNHGGLSNSIGVSMRQFDALIG